MTVAPQPSARDLSAWLLRRQSEETAEDASTGVRAELLALICVLGCLVSVAAVPFWYLSGSPFNAALCAVIGVASLSPLWSLRQTGDLTRAGAQSSVLSWLSLVLLNIQVGGGFIATQIWFSAIVANALLVCRWSAARGFIVLAIIGPSLSHWAATRLHVTPAATSTVGDLQSLTVLLVWFGICAWTHDRASTRMVDELGRQRTAAELARNEAIAAGEARGWFLAQMAHEIRTPMNGVMGMAAILAESELDREQRAWVEVLRTSGDHLLRLLDDTLELARADAGRVSVKVVAFDPTEPVRQVVDLWRGRAESKGLRLRVVLPADLPKGVLTDPVRIRQVISNLVGNAVKYTQRGWVEIRVAVVGPRLSYVVSDTGIGIESTDLPNLFDPFTRSGEAARRRFGGTGLGLAISRSIAEALDGTLDVESSTERGSTFTLHIPYTEAELGPDPVSEEPTDEHRPLRILVVDDHAVNRIVASRVLERAGHLYETAETGEKALEMLMANRYDAALMDCQLPDIDGREVTRRLRVWEREQRRSRLPVVALTATLPSDGASSCAASGMDAFLVKPFDPEVLLRTLLRLTGRRSRAIPRGE
jgi:signal transduction histidine kinase/ActR/RegA family two-component response regulator